jgi:valyl-tRNA synthetase
MLGDTAVAVAPKDERYKPLVGKKILLPIMNREIPIIEDRHVDPSFGSGAVKITPAHDPNDYEMGLTHGLPFINIMTPDGKINENGGSFEGLTMEEGRELVVSKMKELGLLVKIEPHDLRIGISYRSKAIIQPLLSKQWFVKMSAFKKELRKIVETKQVKLVPENWENTYFHWIDNLRDWCVSRQLWWGHRIPIWYNKENPEHMLCQDGEELPTEVAKNPNDWKEEEDVLDTWFSSALLPFSIFDKKEDLDKFYPNSTLVTGHDILFFWVARMILMGSYVQEEVPFKETFLHGLIYGKSYWKTDKTGAAKYILGEEKSSYDLGKALPSDVQFKWEKMSKSKGNVIDPLEIIDSYGTDAIRMALCASATQARQIDLDRRRFEDFKNFANKLWNGSRFVFMNLEGLSPDSFAKGLDEDLFTLEDKWILSQLQRTIEETNTLLEKYHFDKAATTAYDFFWKEFCAYYVEMSKPFLMGKTGTPEVKENKQKLLIIILSTALRLLHPMVPFITEELFSLLKKKFEVDTFSPKDPYTKECLEAFACKACIVAPYPVGVSKEDKNPKIEETFELVNDVLHAIRNIRAEMQIPPSTKVDVWICDTERKGKLQIVKENRNMLEALVKISSLEFLEEVKEPLFSAKKTVNGLQILIPLPEELKEKERARLQKEQVKLEAQLSSLDKKFSQEEFLAKAPEHVLAKLRAQKEEIKASLEAIYTKSKG